MLGEGGTSAERNCLKNVSLVQLFSPALYNIFHGQFQTQIFFHRSESVIIAMPTTNAEKGEKWGFSGNPESRSKIGKN